MEQPLLFRVPVEADDDGEGAGAVVGERGLTNIPEPVGLAARRECWLSWGGEMLTGVEQGAGWLQIIAAGLAFVGTSLQVASSVQQKKDSDPLGLRTFTTIDELKGEVSWARHPWRWWQHRRSVRSLLAEAQVEVRVYQRVRRELWGWVFLWAASVVAVVTAGFALFSR